MFLDHIPKHALQILSAPQLYFRAPPSMIPRSTQLKKARVIDVVTTIGYSIPFWEKQPKHAFIVPVLPVIYEAVENQRTFTALGEFVKRVYIYANPWIALLIDFLFDFEKVTLSRLIVEYIERLDKYGCRIYVPVERQVKNLLCFLAKHGIVEIDGVFVRLTGDLKVKPEEIVRWLLTLPRTVKTIDVYSKYSVEGLATVTWIGRVFYATLKPPREYVIRLVNRHMVNLSQKR